MSTLRPALTGLILAAWLAAACGQAATPTATAPAATGAGGRSATVGELAGTVNGRPAPAEPLAPVSIGFQLRPGGEVQTGEASKARLDFSDGAILRLAANSSFALQSVAAGAEGTTSRVTLDLGKLWVSLFGGELQVETPVGVASVRGSFAVFSYQPGDPNNPDDDLLLVDCLEGSCGAQNDQVNEQLGNLERVVLSRRASLRQTLTEQDVLNFLAENPESLRLVATLTAAPPATETPAGRPSATGTLAALAPETATPTATPTDTPAPAGTSGTSAPAETVVPVTLEPAFVILGFHTVQPRETLFCLGRGYGVLPGAIAAANGLPADAPLNLGQRLAIPAAQWTGIVPGPVCGPQFQSPYPGLPTATSTPTVTATVACPAGQFFDPALNQCRPVSTAPSATPTLTVPPSVTPLPLASATFTPSRTPTTTRTATPTATPTITNTPLPTPIILALSVSPSVISATTYINGTPIAPLCGFSFQAEISDTVGVAQAAIRWTVLDAKPSVVQGPNDEPIFQDGTPYYGYISGFSVPAAGSITWSVVATNTLGLTNSRSGASITDISGAGCTVGVAMVP